MARNDQIVFQAELSLLPQMIDWIRHPLKGLPLSESRKVELSLEEALVNIIRHAYKETKGAIEISWLLDPEKIEYTLKDKGPPFNPLLTEQKASPPETLETQPEGGLGIILMLHYMDTVHYERHDPYNILTLIKNL